MAQAIDLTGQKFNHLTVIERDFSKTGGVYWFCQCDCGNEKLVSVKASNLKSGNTKSCGCLNHKDKFEDLTGQKFNHLTVIKRDSSQERISWFCQCDCGNEELVSVRANNLKTGNTKSCGCLKGANLKERKIDLTGKQFGKLTCIESIKFENGISGWMCKCECGNVTKVVTSNLTKENGIKSCGCVKSKGEQLIVQILNNLNLSYEKEKTYEGLNGDIKKLRFDFFIPEYNTLIEYQGVQHFKSIEMWGGEEQLKKQQKYDFIKKQYCIDNKIKLIEIPYKDFNKLNEEYILNLLNVGEQEN